jgi:hypothetical protein
VVVQGDDQVVAHQPLRALLLVRRDLHFSRSHPIHFARQRE